MTSHLTLQNIDALSSPGGHYSHVVTANNMSFISGLLPLDKQGNPLANKPVEAQITQVLENLNTCLLGINAKKTDIAQVKVYVTDINEWPVVNELYAKWIGEHRPARLVAGVKELHFGSKIEIEAVVIKEQSYE
ncbi:MULTISPECIES: RidA family protein [Proteus]|uniref:RidA family protein n=3 Tax=Proteus terrae TaxID=1574161 RepID=A0A8I1BM08_9GAMM|nr:MULTISPECIES: RidA family protein [Proteus]KLU19264.1 endoribonuclease L-PSP [Proteus mirabilis]QHP76503.1 RidA family protein [Proteus vulgaris]MBG2914596.1 RidA family protein [Proteus terrae subsp. cibarius]MBG3090063.1 RidA family protein [Proteus terrae subsp. cibarius]MCM2366187.1 RidA family protein [Proteus sp. FZP2095]